MGLTKAIKDALRKYNINVPIDRRTKVYKDEVKKYQIEERYILYLKDLISIERKKERKQKKEQQQREKKEQEEREKKEQEDKIRNNVIELRTERLREVVMDGLKKLNALKGKTFRLTIIDYQTKHKITLIFNSIERFNNWFNRLLKNDLPETSSGYEELTNRQLFVLGSVEVNLVDGGYRNFKAKQNNIKLPNGTILKCFNPISQRNNCGLECLKYLLNKEFNNKQIRNKFKIESSACCNVNDLLKIYNHFNTSTKRLEILTIGSNFNINNDVSNYILLYKEHYQVILEKIEDGNITYEDKLTKRGIMIYDLETRYNKDSSVIINNEIAFELEDVLCCVVYKDYKSDEIKKKRFIGYYDANNIYISSCQLFKEFLDYQASINKFYNVWSHNGSRFDNYFLVKALYKMECINEIEKIQLRGFSIIGIQYNSHLFKDSCCFMAKSLSNLCDAFKVKVAKIKEFKLNDKILSNTELCFYKSELNIREFLELERNDKEFWIAYEGYCYADCYSLLEIIERFNNEINLLIEKMSPSALGFCKVIKYNTIGSHSRGIFDYLNKNNPYFKEYCQFLDDDEKLIFLNNFKRGGISHCNKKGKHVHGVVSVDITSQYPASMMFMKLPVGNSIWVDEYKPEYKGYYHIKNLVFDNNVFKPVCGSNKMTENSLNWINEKLEEDYIDTYMLDYLITKCGLISYEVIKGLVSNKDILGSKICGKYISILFECKAEQDEYKINKDERYNPALREVIKLYMNSLSGKFVEDSRKYGNVLLNSNDVEGCKDFNGTNVMIKKDGKMNILIALGVMVYSYSKRLLFEYINMLPNKTNNVIATETDSIYFDKNVLKEFEDNVKNYKGEYPCIFGNELGNIKFEKNTDDVCYFLAKKFYSIAGNNIIKGISQKTIDDNGKEVILVDSKLYEDVYNMKEGDEPITRTMTLIKKQFYGITNIYGTKLTRTIKSTFDYKEY